MTKRHRLAPAIAAALILSGCADKDWTLLSELSGTAAPRPEPAPIPSKKPDPRTPPPRVATAPGAAQVVAVDPARFVGLNMASARTLVGNPHAVRNEGLAVVWAYKVPICSLEIFFYSDIQSQALHALQYTLMDAKGAAVADTERCMRAIQAARTDASG